MKFLKKIIGTIYWFGIWANANDIHTSYTHDVTNVYQFATKFLLLSCLVIIWNFFYRNKYFVVIFLMVCIKLFVQLPKFSLFSIAFLRLFTFMTFSELFADAIQVWTRMTVKELPCVCILHNRKIQWYPKDIWKT